jgi:hypothetical protein
MTGDGPETETVFDLGGESLSLRSAVRAAVDLAAVVERVRAEHEQRAAEEADTALRRRYGLPPK